MPKKIPPKSVHTPQTPRRSIALDEPDAAPVVSVKQTRQVLRNTLKELVERLGRRPTPQEVVTLGRFQNDSYEFYFGGVDQALDEMGVPRSAVSHKEDADAEWRRLEALLPRPDAPDAVALLRRIVTRFREPRHHASHLIAHDDFLRMLSHSDLRAFIMPLWHADHPNRPVPEKVFLISHPAISLSGHDDLVRLREHLGAVGGHESVIAIVKQAGPDGKVRLVPQQLIKSPQWYELGMSISQSRGLVPEGRVEEAIFFEAMGLTYLRSRRVNGDEVALYFQTHGANALPRLLRLRKVAHFGGDVPPLEEKSLVLGYTWSVPYPDTLASLGVHPLGKEPAGLGQHSLIFRWSVNQKRHRPSHTTDELGVAIARGWLQGLGLPVAHPVEEALMRHAIAGDRHRHAETSLDEMVQYADQHQPNPLGRLVRIASVLDDRITPTVRTLRMRMRVHGMRRRFASLRLDPWTEGQELKTEMSIGQFLWANRGSDWRLMHYKGTGADEMAMHFSPDLARREDQVTDAVLTTLAHRGNLALYWDPFVAVLGTPWRLRALKNTLWGRDHPKEIPPNRYALVVIKSMATDNSGFMAQGLRIAPLNPGELPDFTREYGVLVFEHGADGRDYLLQLWGNGAQEMAESVLAGTGIVLTHPVERHLMLRLFSSEAKPLAVNFPLTAEDVVNFVSVHRQEAPQYLARLAHAVRPDFPESPQTMALSGFEYKGKVSGIKLWHGQVNRRDVAEQYFWIQWERQPDGQYVETKVSRDFGKKLVATMHEKGGVTIAPDADAIDQAAETVRRLTQSPEGFTPLDAEMCRPEPMTTPAERMKIEPMVNVPVEVKQGTPGFAPPPLTPKDLAIPPSEGRLHSPSPSGRGQDEGDSVTLPATIGGEVFLPEPPLGMVIAGDMLLIGGVAIIAAAMAAEVPTGIAVGFAHFGRPILAY